MTLNKNVLIQYGDMKKEIQDLRRRIGQLERDIEKIEKEGSVKDTVSGGMGGTQHFVVEGFPVPEYGRKKKQLKVRRDKETQMESELFELINRVEDYINSITSSELRIIFLLYYIDELTWPKVALTMNRMFPKRIYTEESCRKKHSRFLEKVEKCPTPSGK